VSIRAVCDYLGHADPGFTLRIYAHLIPASDEKARRAMDVAFKTLSMPPLPGHTLLEP
jgi:hypothetical protein